MAASPTPAALAGALAAGVLPSVVPFLADLLALRRVPAHSFGVFMSVHPVFVALVGLVVLHQHLDAAAWAAIWAIVGANAVAVTTALSASTKGMVRIRRNGTTG
ncbi:EamA family transporter [Embleya sp. NPDC008237]|uniref:EamA family transporter n=1 Tax=Embleya sp. NPDC008237 TaxID=3363978 RepID=UPI0036ECFCD8